MKVMIVYSGQTWSSPSTEEDCLRLISLGIDLRIIELSSEDNNDFLKGLKGRGLWVRHIPFHSKASYPRAILSAWWEIMKWRPVAVHCHLQVANIVGLTAALLAGVRRRIFTRHHSDWFHITKSRGVFYDNLSNILSSKIVAISEVIKRVLTEKENVKPSKIALVNHGFSLDKFNHVPESLTAAMQSKYNSRGQRPVIGVFSRYIEWKGVQYMLPAFTSLLREYPDALFIFANAFSSPYRENELRPLFEKIPARNLLEVESEPQVQGLYSILDAFVHTPIGPSFEAFGMVYVECLMAGVPMVATKSGIANEILVDRENALIVPHKNSEAIEQALIKILSDSALRQKLKANGPPSVRDRFKAEKTAQALRDLYGGS